MKKIYLLILFFLLYCFVFGQNYSKIIEKQVENTDSIIFIDSLSIIQNTLFLFDSNGNLVNKDLYKIDFSNSIIKLLSIEDLKFPLKIVYRTFPVDLSKKYFHKKFSDYQRTDNESLYNFNNKTIISKQNTFNEELIKSGSISRGISFGNNQDVIVNSNMNLQLSGKISDNLSIIAAISDNNIPIQPDGNTQQIQEFDKVYISVFDDKRKLTLGDFEISKPNSYFLNYYKKVQGISFESNELNLTNKLKYSGNVSGSVAKGNFCRQQFNGKEGSQGPYKLTGCNNESFIIILSGSERIYIDGKLLTRGQDNDYVIDYNNGEVIFTPNQIITKDKRIIVEFEYSDKNYARFLITNSNYFISKKSKYWINIYSETDSKNQSFNQELSPEQKFFLSQIGDSINSAFIPNIDTVDYSNDLVLYESVDTVINSLQYKVFRYSTNPDSAIYRLGFSYVGKNRGNYEPILSSANGKVYKWIAPENNTPMGSYEPVVLLITPKKKQMITIGGENKISPTLIVSYETAISNKDINTFSNLDSKDNTGIAFKYGLLKKLNVKDSTKLLFNTSVNYEFSSKYFSEIENYRSQEFDRDWNNNLKSLANQHLVNYNITYNRFKILFLKYDFEYFNIVSHYNGIRNLLLINSNYKGFNLNTSSSYLISSGHSNTSFLRNKNILSKNIGKYVIGVLTEQESNRWISRSNDTLYSNSFMFNVLEGFFKTNDSLKNNFFINFNNRNDYISDGKNFKKDNNSKNINIGIGLNKNQNNTIRFTANYRVLEYFDTTLINNNSENNINGRIEHSMKFLKGVFASTIFYEIGTGQELKREFSYVEVAHGQGVYAWTDYNSNGIKELNEFEVAVFQDKANYIRIFTPTNEFIKVYSNQLSYTFNIMPQKIWFNKKGIRKFISRFNNNAALRINKKTSSSDFIKIVNSFDNFSGKEDSLIVSVNSTLRNNLSFNRTSSNWGADYIFQVNKNKMLLVNGYDSRYSINNGIKLRWNINNIFTIQEYLNTGNKIYESEYFSTKNYNIKHQHTESTIDIQTNMYFRISLIHKFNIKTNIIGNEKSNTNDFGTEIKYNSPKRGNIVIGLNFIKINYNQISNNSVSYEMLEGLLPGNNLTWMIGVQQNLSESLQLSISYNARKPYDEKIIHNAGVQLRAIF